MTDSRAKSVMSKSEPHGEGTRVSEYIESKFPRKCGACEYFQKPDLCGNKIVMTDKQLKSDPKTKLKIVDAEFGCCRYWEPDKHDLDLDSPYNIKKD